MSLDQVIRILITQSSNESMCKRKSLTCWNAAKKWYRRLQHQIRLVTVLTARILRSPVRHPAQLALHSSAARPPDCVPITGWPFTVTQSTFHNFQSSHRYMRKNDVLSLWKREGSHSVIALLNVHNVTDSLDHMDSPPKPGLDAVSGPLDTPAPSSRQRPLSVVRTPSYFPPNTAAHTTLVPQRAKERATQSPGGLPKPYSHPHNSASTTQSLSENTPTRVTKSTSVLTVGPSSSATRSSPTRQSPAHHHHHHHDHHYVQRLQRQPPDPLPRDTLLVHDNFNIQSLALQVSLAYG